MPKVGRTLTTFMEGAELTNEQMAMDLHVDATMISKMRHDHRNMQDDVAKRSLELYSDLDPYYSMDLIRDFSQGFTAPRINGKSIEFTNRLALEQMAVMESREAINILNEVSFIKPPLETTEQEKERIKQAIEEVAEAEWMLSNLKAALAKAYGLSLKERLIAVFMKWKARGWVA